MTTVAELSERILDETFLHSDISDETIDDEIVVQDETDEFAHYGVKGMKWGVRKKTKTSSGRETPRQRRARLDKIAKENAERKHKERLAKAEYDAQAKAQKRLLKSQEKIRKMELKAEKEAREAETDQQKKDRLDRESRERMAEADRKERAKEQKRALKSQEKIKKADVEGQLKREAEARKDQAKLKDKDLKAQSDREKRLAKQLDKQEKAKLKAEKKTSVFMKHKPTATMTDKELSDAINRLRNEKAFKEATKKPDGLGKKALKAAVVGIAIPVGMNIVKRQLQNIGNDWADEKVGKKARLKLGIPFDGKGSKVNEDYVNRVIEEAFTKRGL